MSQNHWSLKTGLAAICIASLVIACTEKGPTNVQTTLLTGLQEAQGEDSAGTPPPTSPNPSAPGYVRGTVLGPSVPGSGNDSLTTAPRLGGVKVTAYPRVPPTPQDTIGIGPAAATVTTDMNGIFQLPTLPGGEYLVTFVPPEGSIYGGVWVSGEIHDKSHEHQWWVVLWKK